MPIPSEIVFHNVDRSGAVEAAAREQLAKLEHLAPGITSCRVTIEARARSHQAVLFAVRIDIRRSGAETVATRLPHADHEHEDVHMALREAFRTVRRRLLAQRRRRQVGLKHKTIA